MSFLIIQLPAGDFVDNLAVQIARSRREVDEDRLDNLRQQFGLDKPVYMQYLRWFGNYYKVI